MGEEEGGAGMSSNVQDDLSLGLFGDSFYSGSATLVPYSPKIAGGNIKASMQKQVALNKPK